MLCCQNSTHINGATQIQDFSILCQDFRLMGRVPSSSCCKSQTCSSSGPLARPVASALVIVKPRRVCFKARCDNVSGCPMCGRGCCDILPAVNHVSFGQGKCQGCVSNSELGDSVTVSLGAQCVFGCSKMYCMRSYLQAAHSPQEDQRQREEGGGADRGTGQGVLT